MHPALEVGDEPLALGHQPAPRDSPGVETALNRLPERDVFLGDLRVPRHELLDLGVGDLDAEEVVRHLDRALEAVRDPPLDARILASSV